MSHCDIESDWNGGLVPGLNAYENNFDWLTETFGEDRVMFCSNYPQSVGPVVSSVAAISKLAKEFYAS
jgi:predicted TIM-barrel fold metal-dependent hydrolase